MKRVTSTFWVFFTDPSMVLVIMPNSTPLMAGGRSVGVIRDANHVEVICKGVAVKYLIAVG
jgi:hypothetical protein